MPRKPRDEVADPERFRVFDAIQRCRCRALLCGDNLLTGQFFEHRRQWNSRTSGVSGGGAWPRLPEPHGALESLASCLSQSPRCGRNVVG